VNAVHDYIGIAESRNTKLLEYTNDCTLYLTLTGKIEQKQEEINRIKSEIAQENVPGLISYRNFLYGLYEDFKVLCLKYLYQENRAFIYWSQQDSAFNVADDSFVGLGTFHATLKTKIIDQINTVNNPSQPLSDIRVVLSAKGPDKRTDQFADSIAAMCASPQFLEFGRGRQSVQSTVPPPSSLCAEVESSGFSLSRLLREPVGSTMVPGDRIFYLTSTTVS
jgi:hypothetical protein